MSIQEEFLWRSDGGFIRIPVWGHIPLTKPLKRIIAHPAFFRLKGIKQLSFAHYVFPGATHTRFEHSIGVYHLMKMILQRVLSNNLTSSLQTDDFQFNPYTQRLLLVSSLLHDIGHYPHAHILEKVPLGSQPVFEEHEHLVHERLMDQDRDKNTLESIIQTDWDVDPKDVVALISGKDHPYGKLISGTLDPDKMDYLMRDAHHCSIPYGSIDIERLIESLVPDAQLRRFAITEKGIAPLESLMFAKYMMMRNVYWHHTVRTLSLMLQRLIQDCLADSLLGREDIRRLFYTNADERVLYDLQAVCQARHNHLHPLIEAIIDRTPYKRVLELNYNHPRLLDSGVQEKLEWIGRDLSRKKALEEEIAEKLSRKLGIEVKGHEILIDLPAKKHIFDYDDFCQLRVYHSRRSQAGYYESFNESGESAFQSEFIKRFEMATKKIRVVASPVVAERIQGTGELLLDFIL